MQTTVYVPILVVASGPYRLYDIKFGGHQVPNTLPTNILQDNSIMVASFEAEVGKVAEFKMCHGVESFDVIYT